MTSLHSTDPADELFDVLTEDGRPTGETKRRADVHRDGDWHRAFHLWVVQKPQDGIDRVLFQRRSSGKDTWPNRLDVAVGGHFRAGETIHDVIREADEEIGIQPELSDLVHVGTRRATSFTDEWQDRELQDVYVFAIRGPFPTFQPNAIEIESLVHIAIVDLERLFRGGCAEVPGMVAPVLVDNILGDWRPSSVTANDFVPVKDEYFLRGAMAGQAALNGNTSISLE